MPGETQIIDDGHSPIAHIRVKCAVYHVTISGDGEQVECLETFHTIGCKNRHEGLAEMARYLEGNRVHQCQVKHE